MSEHEAVVHKANLDLKDGESLGEYTSSLQAAARGYVIQHLNLDKDKSGCYVLEVYVSTVVLDVYDYTSSKYRFYSVTYDRSGDGWTFTDMVEVERVTTYRPKSDLVVKKSLAGAERQVESFITGEGADGWRPLSKGSDIWTGVL